MSASPRNDAEIDGGAQNQGIGRLDFFKDGPEIILDGTPAITLAAPGFAGKTADAAFKIEIIQMHEFGFGPLGGGPFQGFFQQGGRIPGFSGAAVNRHDLHQPRPSQAA